MIKNKRKIIIWGYPLYSDTYSFIQHGFYRAAWVLGYEVYWFDDKNHPSVEDFDYTNSIFITEGFADKQIPVVKDGVYYVHVCVNPDKYLEKVERLIDVRYLQRSMDNDNYDFVFDKTTATKLDEGVYADTTSFKYTALYTAWASNLLPEEIDFDWRFKERENIYWYIGTISTAGRFENWSKIEPFVKICKQHQISFVHWNPWIKALTEEEQIDRTQKSYLVPDFRGDQHLKWGYLACRPLKAISYGQLGLTNSPDMYEFLEGNVIYADSAQELFDLGIKHKDNCDMILSQMKLIKDKHTFVNRLKGMLSIL